MMRLLLLTLEGLCLVYGIILFGLYSLKLPINFYTLTLACLLLMVVMSVLIFSVKTKIQHSMVIVLCILSLITGKFYASMLVDDLSQKVSSV